MLMLVNNAGIEQFGRFADCSTCPAEGTNLRRTGNSPSAVNTGLGRVDPSRALRFRDGWRI